MGVMVENGIVKVGTPICVPSKEVSEGIEGAELPIPMPGKYLTILRCASVTKGSFNGNALCE